MRAENLHHTSTWWSSAGSYLQSTDGLGSVAPPEVCEGPGMLYFVKTPWGESDKQAS